MTTLAVGDLPRQVLDLLAYLMRSSTATVRTECPEALPRERADRTQMVQILLNLAGTAVGGPGIPAEKREEIWEPFDTTKPEDTGLGLPVIRSLVAEQPGARLTVERFEGQGTTFWLAMSAVG